MPNMGDTVWTAGSLFLCAVALVGLLQATKRLGAERGLPDRRVSDRRVSDRRGAEVLGPAAAGPEPDGAEQEEQPQRVPTDGAPPLGEMLVSYGLITEANLQKALARQRKRGRRLGQVLVEMRLVTLDQVLAVLEEQTSRRSHGVTQTAPEAPQRSDAEPARAAVADECSVFTKSE
jgi:hypothetical protein